jgi:hypothetical protein
MRHTLLTAAALCSLACAAPALAQTATGTAPAAPNAGNEMPQSPNSVPPGAAVNGAPGADATPAPSSPDQGMAAPTPMKHHSMHHMAKATDSADDSTGSGNWAHQPGTGESGPASAKASNIDQADSHSTIAPHFPSPKVGENAGPEQYLRVAEKALAAHKTGEAQQALEMAETRLLDRSTPVNAAGQPDADPMVSSVSKARLALGHGDLAGASSDIKMALGGQ